MTIVSLLSRAQAPLEAFEVFSRRKGASDCKSIFIGESGGALSQHVPMPKIIKAKADDHSGKQQRAKQPINFTPWLRLLLVVNKKKTSSTLSVVRLSTRFERTFISSSRTRKRKQKAFGQNLNCLANKK
jgi:hypothetical protein